MKINMKRKEIWSFGLYRESLRRVRIPAVIFLAIITAAAILEPVTIAVTHMTYQNYEPLGTINAIAANPLLLLTIFAIAPAITYTLFSFLNKRSSSDMYSSMPHTRISQYVSRIAAVATVSAGIILITTAVSVLLFGILDTGFTYEWSSLLPYLTGCFVGSMLVCAIITVAMSITGTLLNNIVVSALIMFLPRVILSLILYAVDSRFPLFIAEKGNGFLQLNLNILTGFFGFLSGEEFALTSSVSQIYSFCLVLVYFAIGAFLFCRRKSESAEHAAPTRRMQSVFRIIVTMTVCIPVCFIMFANGATDRYENFYITLYVWFYVAALITFCAYELITTKKWRNLIKSLPSLIIVVILNFLFIGAMYTVYTAEVNFTPDPEDVSYFSIVAPRNYSNTFISYAENKVSDIEITDPEAKLIVCRTLKDNVDYFKEESSMYKYRSYYSSSVEKEEDYVTCTVKIKSGLSVKYRKIYFSTNDYSKICDILESTEEYRDAWMTLPEPTKGTLYTELGNAKELENSDAKMAELFATLRDEVTGLDLETWSTALKSGKVEFASVSYSAGKDYIHISIDPSVLPETANHIALLRNECCPYTAEEIKEALIAGDVGETKKFNINDAEYKGADGTYYYANMKRKDLAKCIDTEAELDISEGYLVLNILTHDWPDDGGMSYYMSYIYIPVTEEGLKILGVTKGK